MAIEPIPPIPPLPPAIKAIMLARIADIFTLLESSNEYLNAALESLEQERLELGVLKTNIGIFKTSNLTTLEELTEFFDSLSGQVLKVGTEIGGIIADSNKTNHVVVYVLAKDANGYYKSPSASLLSALEVYLEERRLINVTLECTDGMTMVKKCGVDVDVKIKKGYKSAVVIMEIKKEIEALLKNRNFGESLYLSKLYSIVEDIEGVDYANIGITSIDDDDLIVDGNFVLTDSHQILSRDDGDIASVISITEL